MTILDSLKAYRPVNITFDVLTNRDTTRAMVDCGDFYLNMTPAEDTSICSRASRSSAACSQRKSPTDASTMWRCASNCRRPTSA